MSVLLTDDQKRLLEDATVEELRQRAEWLNHYPNGLCGRERVVPLYKAGKPPLAFLPKPCAASGYSQEQNYGWARVTEACDWELKDFVLMNGAFEENHGPHWHVVERHTLIRCVDLSADETLKRAWLLFQDAANRHSRGANGLIPAIAGDRL